jgi:hypothetical protein
MRRSRGSVLLVAGVAVALLVPAGASATTRVHRARNALRFIAANQLSDGSVPAFSTIGSTADAVLAMAAARRGPRREDRALHYLRSHIGNATSIGLKAKVVLAAVAGGRRPRSFGGVNLVKDLKTSQRRNGHLGRGKSVIDQALGMLALVSARVQPPRPVARWLTRAQCPDGGWQYDAPYNPSTDNRHCHDRSATDFSRSDTNTTSYAIQALDAMAAPAAPRHNAFFYFRSVRDPIKHGWGYDRKTRLTDANSTALVIQAYVAAGRLLPSHAMRALKRLQYVRLCGRNFPFAFSFTWKKTTSGSYRRTGADVGATLGGILGLLKQPLPVPSTGITKHIPRITRPC